MEIKHHWIKYKSQYDNIPTFLNKRDQEILYRRPNIHSLPSNAIQQSTFTIVSLPAWSTSVRTPLLSSCQMTLNHFKQSWYLPFVVFAKASVIEDHCSGLTFTSLNPLKMKDLTTESLPPAFCQRWMFYLWPFLKRLILSKSSSLPHSSKLNVTVFQVYLHYRHLLVIKFQWA